MCDISGENSRSRSRTPKLQMRSSTGRETQRAVKVVSMKKCFKSAVRRAFAYKLYNPDDSDPERQRRNMRSAIFSSPRVYILLEIDHFDWYVQMYDYEFGKRQDIESRLRGDSIIVTEV